MSENGFVSCCRYPQFKAFASSIWLSARGPEPQAICDRADLAQGQVDKL